MPEYSSISRQKPAFPDYLDFENLRAIGIEHLQRLSGKLWTDYNLHDPGVTILEVLCYAVTDLGYRNNLDIQDLLAKDPTAPTPDEEDNFFTPDQVLTCNPVTELDLRKRLLDIEGVRNAWIKPFNDYKLVHQPDSQQWIVNLEPDSLESGSLEPDTPNFDSANLDIAAVQPHQALPNFHLKGLYTVLLDLDSSPHRDACGQFYDARSNILNDVKAVLHSYRNLCEDFHELVVLGEEVIGLRGTLELDANADANDVLVEIFVRIQDFLAPHILFYTLEELLDRGKNPAEIFAGRPSAIARHDENSPYATTQSHGFIDPEELEALTLPSQLHTSDLYQIILNVPGVVTVNTLSIRSYINGLPQSPEQLWYLDLTPNYHPVLGIDQSHLSLLKGGLPTAINLDTVKRRYAQQKLTHLKAHREDVELDLPIPQGTYHADMADHYSIHHDFPLTYGISEEGLPANVSAQRKAQAKQLKGYLVFFDQILANYLVQLSHVRELFSWKETDLTRTAFSQMLDFPGAAEIFEISNQTPSKLDDEFLNHISEDPTTASERRNRFLDHMLARFAESFTDYVLLNYRINGGSAANQDNADIIHDKAHYLQDYPLLSRDRFRAANYACQDGWHSHRISGFEKRIARLLGIENLRRRSLIHYSVVHQPSHFTVQLGWRAGEQESDRPLLCRQTYSTLEAAQAALDKLLNCVLNPAHYQRLVYRNAYHSLEVVDDDGTSLVFYDQSYPTEAARNAAVASLIERIRQVLPRQSVSVLQDEMIEFDPSEQGVGFLLKLSPTQPQLRFVSAQRYNDRDAARDAAAKALEQIQSESFYHPISLHPNEVDPTVSVDGKLTTYGFAVVDEQGKTLADMDSSLGLDSAIARDAVICALHTSQSSMRIESRDGGFGFAFNVFELNDPKGRRMVVRSTTLYASEPDVEQAIHELADCLRLLRCYQIHWVDEDSPQPRYQLRITDRRRDRQEQVLAESEPLEPTSPDPESDRLAAFKWINSMSPYLLIEGELQDGTDNDAGCRFQVLDRCGSVLLQGTQLYADENTARDHFYRDVLGILWEPEATLTQLEELCRFEVEPEREQAIQRLKVLACTAHLNVTIQQTYPGYVGQIACQDQAHLLQGTQRFTYELAVLTDASSPAGLTAWHDMGERWDTLVASVAEHLAEYRSGEGSDRPLELDIRHIDERNTNSSGYRFCLEPSHAPADQPWQLISSASYSTYRKAEAEGNYALNLLRTSDPSLLQRQLRDVEYTLVLFGSDQAQQAEAAAWNHGNILIRLAETDDSFRRIDPQSPCPATTHPLNQTSSAAYSWALSGREQHSTLAIHPNGYSQPEEREQSILSLQQDYINDEGFHTIEHILLRPRQTEVDLAVHPDAPQPDHRAATLPILFLPGQSRDGGITAERLPFDPYSFWISVVLPAWPKRFQDKTFRQFVERTLRLEAPAHVALKIAWVDIRQMRQFEVAYRAWLEQMALATCEGEACRQTHTLKNLLQILSELRGIYPAATLADPETSDFAQNPVILTQTPLGNTYD